MIAVTCPATSLFTSTPWIACRVPTASSVGSQAVIATVTAVTVGAGMGCENMAISDWI